MAKKADSRKKTPDKIAETDRSVKRRASVPTRKRATVASHARTQYPHKQTVAMASSLQGTMTAVENRGKLMEVFGKGGPPIPFVKKIFLIECETAGTTYVSGIAQKTMKIVPGSVLAFCREPTNEYDPLAILILNECNEKIGYVPRTQNEILAHLMNGGKLLFGRVEEKRIQNDWIHIVIKVYMRDL